MTMASEISRAPLARLYEVRGIGMPNKGAELMLLAIKEHFGQKQRSIEFASSPFTSFKARAKYELFQKADYQLKGFDFSKFLAWAPRSLRKQYGIVRESDIDAILDASGFAYGEQWGHAKLRKRVVDKIATWKRQGKKVIFLPQAFGPFDAKEFRPLVEEMIANADLIFARDKESYNALGGEVHDNIFLSPDITTLIDSGKYKRNNSAARTFCIIPNNKIIEMTGEGERYLEALSDTIKLLRSRGWSPFVLNHEGEQDLHIGREIIKRSGYDIPMVNHNDPWQLKSIIAGSSGVLSSRFHGLVSALSSGVPAVSFGWSHKYDELMEDYSVDHLAAGSTQEIVQKIDWLLSVEMQSDVPRILNARASQQKQQVREMWKLVDRTLGHD
ncbi:polysaccharide pyruvyl transferase family protein [Tranquillimonas rosea]|uniref:polysaccharide pyruvyl transferase family protein n=1 Tax=Tranquillimonas rosea TaxID=641238 RepID=UPI003BA85557